MPARLFEIPVKKEGGGGESNGGIASARACAPHCLAKESSDVDLDSVASAETIHFHQHQNARAEAEAEAADEQETRMTARMLRDATETWKERIVDSVDAARQNWASIFDATVIPFVKNVFLNNMDTVRSQQSEVEEMEAKLNRLDEVLQNVKEIITPFPSIENNGGGEFITELDSS